MSSGRQWSRCSRPRPRRPRWAVTGPGVPDQLCFGGILLRLVTGALWVDIQAILDHQVSDTTLRARWDEWIDAGVLEQVRTEALGRSTRSSASTGRRDGGRVAAQGPHGGEGTGPDPTDRARLGWKWSVAAERHGIPIGWAIDGANRNDVALLEPTMAAVGQPGLLAEPGVLHLDRSHDPPAVRDRLRAAGLDQFEIQRRGTKTPGVKRQPLRLGLRWIVEATTTWWSNDGQLRRNTDRRARHRHAARCLATTILIVGRLIDWRNRWNPTRPPIRSSP
jgi:hypothetical protein